MANRIKKNFLPEDFEIQIHKKIKGLKQKYLIVTSYDE